MRGSRVRLLVVWLSVLVLAAAGVSAVQAETLSAMIRLSTQAVQAPTGVALDAAEALYVVESSYKRLVVIDNGGRRIGEVRGFDQPKCVAVDGAGRVYVSDAGRGNVTVFGPDLAMLGTLGAGDGEFLKPLGVAVSAAGDVYVVDNTRNQVRVYGPNRQLIREFGEFGSEAGQLREPISIAVDEGTDEIVVVDLPLVPGDYGLYEGSRVQVFDATGRYLRGFGQNGVGEGRLAKVMAVAVDHQGKIYVSDTYQNIVEVFSRTGSYLETVYDGTAKLRTPVGVALGGITGRLFVSSVSLNRVDIFGEPLGHIVNAESSAGGMITPGGAVAVQHGGAISFKMTALPGYRLTGVFVDGVNVGAVPEYHIPIVMAGHTVRAEYCAIAHTVLVETAGGGMVDPLGAITVLEQDDLSLAMTPDAGFRVADVVVDGRSVGPLESYTLRGVTADHTVVVAFERQTYQITALSTAGGSIQPAGDRSVEAGSSLEFAFAADPGYRLSRVLVDGQPVVAESCYSFENISASHVIRVEYARISHSIAIAVAGQGSAEPCGDIEVADGEPLTIAFSPAPGYRLSGIQVDGQAIEPCGCYTFSAVRADHRVAVQFGGMNVQPVSIAGPEQLLGAAVKTITLNGSHSFDPDGSSLTYLWEQTGGPPVILADPTAPSISFRAPRAGRHGSTLEFRLTVTDEQGLSAQDSCLVTLAHSNNLPPLADAGSDQWVEGGETVLLDGSGSVDDHRAIVSYLWQQISGEPVVLADAQSAVASFIAPHDVTSALAFRLLVTDRRGLKATSVCRVNVPTEATAPVAEAGADLVVRTGETVELNALTDANAAGCAYLWKQTKGTPPVCLQDHTSAKASWIAPKVPSYSDGKQVYRLEVTDEAGLVTTDSVTVRIKKRLPAKGR